MTESETRSPLLEVRNLSKHFGAVKALNDVTFELYEGEVLGLVGDNGAGKSTLIKCLSGVILPSSGVIMIRGKKVVLSSPKVSRAYGIETVYQELALVPTLSVAENLFLNRELTRGSGVFAKLGWLNRKDMYHETVKLLNDLHIKIDSPKASVDRLSGGQRQAVAIARAVAWGRSLVLMDEPAAALGVEQAKVVMDLVKQLKARGISVILVSHNMEHIMEVCDRAIVLRLGKLVGNVNIKDTNLDHLVSLIMGSLHDRSSASGC